MSSITKFTGYAVAVLASLAVALALLVAAPAKEAAAGPVTVTALAEISANGSIEITVTDPNLPQARAGAQTGFAIFTINPASTGTARFKAASGQSLICLNNSDCDVGRDNEAVPPEHDDTTIVVRVDAQGRTGVVVVDVQVVHDRCHRRAFGAGCMDADGPGDHAQGPMRTSSLPHRMVAPPPPF